EELERRIAAGRVSAALGEKIASFMKNGFIILPGAVPESAVDRLAAVINESYAKGNPSLRYHTDGLEHLVLQPNTDPSGKRIVEAHAVLPEIREVLSAPAILDFLNAIFDEPPALTQ